MKELSDILSPPEKNGDTGFRLGGKTKEDILYKNGKPTGFSICKHLTGRDDRLYLYNKGGEELGVLEKKLRYYIFDNQNRKTGFYLNSEHKIYYDNNSDER